MHASIWVPFVLGPARAALARTRETCASSPTQCLFVHTHRTCVHPGDARAPRADAWGGYMCAHGPGRKCAPRHHKNAFCAFRSPAHAPLHGADFCTAAAFVELNYLLFHTFLLFAELRVWRSLAWADILTSSMKPAENPRGQVRTAPVGAGLGGACRCVKCPPTRVGFAAGAAMHGKIPPKDARKSTFLVKRGQMGHF